MPATRHGRPRNLPPRGFRALGCNGSGTTARSSARAASRYSFSPGGSVDGYYAWMIVATALVLMMTTPALALFYGGMSRSKSVLNMMMMSYVALAVVGIVFVLWGWSMGWGGDGVGNANGKLIANPFDMFGLDGVSHGNYIYVLFQLTFAAITAALISGSIADRVKLSSWIVFVIGWVTLAYFPIAHNVWGGGWLDTQVPEPRLRRWHRRAHQRRYRRRRARTDHRAAHRVRQGADASAQPDPDHDRCRPALVRLVRLQRRFDRVHGRLALGPGEVLRAVLLRDRRDLHEHDARHHGRVARLAAGGADPARQGDLARRCLRHRCRPGRDHPVLWRGRHPRRDHHRRPGRHGLRGGGRPQVQAQVGRLARRRRRAPGRRHARRPGDRLPRDRQVAAGR